MEDIDEAKLAQLKAEHGELYVLQTEHHTIVFKPAPADEWERFQRDSEDTKKKFQAVRTLAVVCTVHPPRDEFKAILSRHPLLADRVCGELINIAGDMKLDNAKKA